MPGHRLGIAVVALTLGCGSSSGTDMATASDLASAATDMVTTDFSVTPDLATCSDLSLAAAPMLQLQYVASAPPTPAGGTFADGTYVATAGAIYTGAGGQSGPVPGTYQAIFRFTAGRYEQVSDSGGGPGRLSGTFTTSGSTLSLNVQCPASIPNLAETYSVTASGLTLGLVNPGSTVTELSLTPQ